MEDGFPLFDAPAVTSCGAVWLNIIEVLAHKQDVVFADLKDYISEEAFILLDPALKQVKFLESVDIHAIVAQGVSPSLTSSSNLF
jgi:hypothetical protein